MTFKGAVVGCEPTAAGPKGLARCRKESASTIALEKSNSTWIIALQILQLEM